MQVKTKQAAVLTLALTIIILISNNFSCGLITQEIAANQSTSGLTVLSHKITSEEIQQLSARVISGQDINQTQKIDGHGTGLTGLTSQDLSEIALNAQVVDSITYQAGAAFDNTATEWFPPIGNQDGQGSCVAWAVGYYVKTFQEAKEHNWNLTGATWDGGYYGHPTTAYQDKIMSPQFVYSLLDKGVDQGTSFEAAINLVASIGTSSWQKMPFTPSDVTSWPSETAWTEAAYYRSAKSPNYQYINAYNDAGITSLKNWLAAGNLAVIAVDANKYSSLSSQDLWATYTFDADALNHANTIVGYDDNYAYNLSGVMHYGAFKVANSWGIGGTWEHVADGYYYISYDAMKSLSNSQNPAIIFSDLTGYQPEISASFQITHSLRGECIITLGYGTPAHPTATKVFSSTVLGGSQPFCSNNIVVDITEFKSSMSSLYNQPFFLSVYDGGTTATGTINYYAVQDTAAIGTPLATRNAATVTLTVNASIIKPAFTISPTTGAAGTSITMQGTGFTGGNTVNLAYLDPVTSNWVQIANNIAVAQSNNFTYTTNAPDIGVANAAGDNPQASDTINFSATDIGSGQTVISNTTFAENRKGLTVIGNAVASGLFGNCTDLSSTVTVQSGQSLVVCGKNFNPGSITVLYDGVYDIGTINVAQDGTFNTTVNIPSLGTTGKHNVSLGGVGNNFMFAITRLPQVVTDYDGAWHSTDFTVNLSADGSGVSEIYYKINGGQTQNVSANGQPQFTSEGVGNMLEYWGTWNGGATIELIHNTLSGIKLDKSAPSGSMQINGGSEYSSSPTVILTITGQDALSGVQKMRFSNDGSWSSASWQTFSSSTSWTLGNGDGQKTIYCQIMDNAGNTASFQASIHLDTTKPSIGTVASSSSVVGSNVNFVANSTDQNGITKYTWNFGDDSTAQGMQVNHVYATAGNYTVTLTVQDNAGNTAQSTFNVIVESNSQSNSNPTPTPSASTSTIPSTTTSSSPSNSNNPTITQFPIGTASVLAVLFAMIGVSLIIVKFKRKIFSRSN